jgi:bifunctional enzyme CysN/CysC
VRFLPSGKESEIATVERFHAPVRPSAEAGEAIGMTLTTQVYVKPGELMVRTDQPPAHVGGRFRANLFWMGRSPMVQNRQYKLKHGAARSPVQLVQVLTVIDASELTSVQNKLQIDRHDVAECILECPKPIAFDLEHENAETGRFVIVDNFEIAGAGVVLDPVAGEESTLKDHFLAREQHWEGSAVTAAEREGVFRHKAKFVVFTGVNETGSSQTASDLAKALELRLFRNGFKAYYLGFSALEAGLEADLGSGDFEAGSRVRRLGELARILTGSGQIFITSLPDLDEYDLEALELLNRPNEILVVNVGSPAYTRYEPALALDPDSDPEDAVARVFELLRRKEVIADYVI